MLFVLYKIIKEKEKTQMKRNNRLVPLDVIIIKVLYVFLYVNVKPKPSQNEHLLKLIVMQRF